MRIDLRGARLYDPALGLDRTADVLIEDGVVAGIGSGLPPGDKTLAADGLLLLPGLVDVHVHLREPGEVHKEEIATGLGAALRGGFTDVCAMANTRPAVDTALVLRDILAKAERSPVALHQLASVTVGLEGRRLTEFGSLQAAGAVAFSDDGRGIASAAVMRLALQYAQAFSALIVTHAEDPELAGAGVLHEGRQSFLLGLPGQPRSAESAMVARDLELLRECGGRLHIAHVSTRETVALVRQAKAEGLHVSCEVTPHHLLLCEDDVPRLGTRAKMNPPLRTAADRAALRAALRDGTIDAVASDHAPHAAYEKETGLQHAPFGVIGLETAFAAAYSLVEEGEIALPRLVDAFTDAPRRAFGLERPRIREGEAARLTLLDPGARWTVAEGDLRSRSRNSPFIGRSLPVRPVGIFSKGGFWSADA